MFWRIILEFKRVTEHFEELNRMKWSPEESTTHGVAQGFYTICGIPIGNYQSGWVWGEYADSYYCSSCFEKGE